MYTAARNCTEPRVDGAAHEILFVLEICSELMLRLASLAQCIARSAPEYPSANLLRSMGRAPARSHSSSPRPPCLLILVQSFKMSFATTWQMVVTSFRFSLTALTPRLNSSELRTNAPATGHIE